MLTMFQSNGLLWPFKECPILYQIQRMAKFQNKGIKSAVSKLTIKTDNQTDGHTGVDKTLSEFR